MSLGERIKTGVHVAVIDVGDKISNAVESVRSAPGRVWQAIKDGVGRWKEGRLQRNLNNTREKMEARQGRVTALQERMKDPKLIPGSRKHEALKRSLARMEKGMDLYKKQRELYAGALKEHYGPKIKENRMEHENIGRSLDKLKERSSGVDSDIREGEGDLRALRVLLKEVQGDQTRVREFQECTTAIAQQEIALRRSYDIRMRMQRDLDRLTHMYDSTGETLSDQERVLAGYAATEKDGAYGLGSERELDDFMRKYRTTELGSAEPRGETRSERGSIERVGPAPETEVVIESKEDAYDTGVWIARWNSLSERADVFKNILQLTDDEMVAIGNEVGRGKKMTGKEFVGVLEKTGVRTREDSESIVRELDYQIKRSIAGT